MSNSTDMLRERFQALQDAINNLRSEVNWSTATEEWSAVFFEIGRMEMTLQDAERKYNALHRKCEQLQEQITKGWEDCGDND